MAYININIELPKELKEKLETVAIEQLVKLIDPYSAETKAIIRDCTKGAITSRIYEILDEKEYRKQLRDQIMKQLNIGEISSKEGI